ncbi:MAG: peptidylprolyl isomerase [Desulfobacteraceae bacterium]|jgi:peptidyl-prolyl cis-trans isomerase C|nr:peptidylprolyl isomerase [Desulfobacteraceae bacterium]
MKFDNCRRLYQITAILILVLFSFPAMAAEQTASGEKAAVVNGVVITRAHYEKELKVHLDRSTQQGRPVSDEQMPELKKTVLEGLIEREVLYQESQKAGIKIPDQKVNDQMAGIRKRFPDEAEFKKALASMGLTEEEVRTQIQRGLAIRGLIDQKVADKIVVTDEETKAYYDANPKMFKQPDEVKASHILIKVEPTADDAAKAAALKKIEDIRKKLTDGGDFAELAKEYSEGPSGPQGGDLGFFRRGQMVKPFEDTAFSMKTNEVSAPVETRFGYHLIKVTDKRPEQTLAYADVKDKIAQRLKAEKIQKAANLYVENLKKDAKIEILL